MSNDEDLDETVYIILHEGCGGRGRLDVLGAIVCSKCGEVLFTSLEDDDGGCDA